MHTSKSLLHTLPDELLERILITCAEDGHAETVAAAAATSKRLHSIIYNTTDHHLWRSMLLVSFDDPRTLRCGNVGIHWKQDLQDRLWTHRYISQHAPSTISVNVKYAHHSMQVHAMYCVDRPSAAEESAHVRALRTMASVIHTSTTDPRSSSVGQARLLSHNLVQLHMQTPKWPPALPPIYPSSNMAWLTEILANGLPAVLTATISLDQTEDDWHETSAGLAVGQVVSYLGFLPIPPEGPGPGTFVIRITPPSGRAPRRNPGPPEMDEESQRDRAHWHACRKAFDMDYLSPWRNWGPFLSNFPDGVSPDSSKEDEDPDWRLAGHRSRATEVPPAEKLLPDWSWLGAARVVAECTLRAHQSANDIEKLEAWDNLREGAWLGPPSTAGYPGSEPGVNRKGAIGGHDWAGAEGMWRRLVCWLGYDDLIRHNHSGRFRNPGLQAEAWIIVPISLHIAGYSPSPIPAYADRPTIHVEGEMGGAAWDGHTGADEDDVRRVHGTVSMLADGSVRWSITSTDEDNTADEWASEAIQLGGVGSAMGMLGMWTGAQHEDDDPVGVIWQWRVG